MKYIRNNVNAYRSVIVVSIESQKQPKKSQNVHRQQASLSAESTEIVTIRVIHISSGNKNVYSERQLA